MRTTTTQYQFSHGRQPKGYGLWWLRLTGMDGNGAYTTEQYQEYGTLNEAKRNAVRRMKAEIGRVKQIVEIEVMP